MTRYKLLIGATATAFVLSALPAAAQRPGGGGQGGGGAERSPGGGGPSGGGGGGGGGSSSSGSSGSGSGSSMSSPSGGGGDTAPSRPSDSPSRGNPRAGAPERRGGGERAVPRGAGTGESRGTSRVGASGASSGDHNNDRATDRAVPAYSRPREGRPATGSVADRQTPIRGRNDSYPYYSNYYSRSYGWPGYGLGLGYYAYDPLWFDPYYDPYYGGGGYGGGGYSGGGYAGGSGGYGYQGSQGYRDTGSLRLKIKPREAKVFIDGYFVGAVDSFDGLFQKLGLEAGGHRVEIRADGYEPLQFEVLITPGEAVTYKGELKRIQ